MAYFQEGKSSNSSFRDVIVFIHYYLPGYESGGPLRSLENMVEHLGNEFNFHIITCNHDLLSRAPYPNIEADRWLKVGKAQVWYKSGSVEGNLALIKSLKKLHHAPIYLHSLFDPFFSIAPLILQKLGILRNKKVILAPRGELSRGALQLKWLKKSIFLATARTLGIYRGIIWHASTALEADDISRELFKNKMPSPMHIARDLLAPRKHIEDPNNSNDLVFISRISPKKNLDYALRVLSLSKELIYFHIYGTIEDVFYWKKCLEIIDSLPPNIKTVFHGALKPEKVQQTLSQHGCLFFPTKGENYGHVIAEALAAGIPTLISDQTPWNNINEEGAGWALPLDQPQAFRSAIENFIGMDAASRARQRESVRNYVDRYLYVASDIEDSRQLLKAAAIEEDQRD